MELRIALCSRRENRARSLLGSGLRHAPQGSGGRQADPLAWAAIGFNSCLRLLDIFPLHLLDRGRAETAMTEQVSITASARRMIEKVGHCLTF